MLGIRSQIWLVCGVFLVVAVLVFSLSSLDGGPAYEGGDGTWPAAGGPGDGAHDAAIARRSVSAGRAAASGPGRGPDGTRDAAAAAEAKVPDGTPGGAARVADARSGRDLAPDGVAEAAVADLAARGAPRKRGGAAPGTRRQLYQPGLAAVGREAYREAQVGEERSQDDRGEEELPAAYDDPAIYDYEYAMTLEPRTGDPIADLLVRRRVWGEPDIANDPERLETLKQMAQETADGMDYGERDAIERNRTLLTPSARQKVGHFMRRPVP